MNSVRMSIIEELNSNDLGLEISPLYNPIAKKSNFNVMYTDCVSKKESIRKHAHYEHAEIIDLDFIWEPGRKLSICVPKKKKFKFAIASHVLEHVPDPISWVMEVFEVLENEALLYLILPDKRSCYDHFRPETTVAELLDFWFNKRIIPTTAQIYDFLTLSFDDSDGQPPTTKRELIRHYDIQQALNFAVHAWVKGKYLDIHCSNFTPQSFVKVFQTLNDLGILNIKISEPISTSKMWGNEFMVKLRKIGEPRTHHPGSPHRNNVGRLR